MWIYVQWLHVECHVIAKFKLVYGCINYKILEFFCPSTFKNTCPKWQVDGPLVKPMIHTQHGVPIPQIRWDLASQDRQSHGSVMCFFFFQTRKHRNNKTIPRKNNKLTKRAKKKGKLYETICKHKAEFNFAQVRLYTPWIRFPFMLEL